MVAESGANVAMLSSDLSACPFCGQALLNTKAVEHLAHQRAAYEVELRRSVEAEVQSSADAQLQQVELSLKADAAEQVKAAAAARSAEVADLNRRLVDAEKKQATMVKAEVQKRLAATEETERARLEQEFAKREKQLKLTVQKLEEQKRELSRRVERLSAGERGDFNEEEFTRRRQLLHSTPAQSS